MPKHNHIDSARAQEVGERLLKGRTDIIVPCDECRSRVREVLESKEIRMDQADVGMDVGTVQAQLEMTADFYKKYKTLVACPKPKNLSQAQFIHSAIERLSHNEIVGK
jgi:hypothetical protein